MRRIYYVDPVSGNDSNTGLSDAQAWLTLAKVVSEAGNGTFDGDQVWFKPGANYTTRFITNGFAPVNHVLFRNDPRYAERPVIVSNDSHAILAVDTQRTTFMGFECQQPTVTPASTVTMTGTCTDVIFDSLYIPGSAQNGVILGGTLLTRPVVRRCIITDTAEDAVGGQGAINSFLCEFNTIDKAGDGSFAGSSGDGFSFHEDNNGTIRFNNVRRCCKGGIANVQRSGHTIYCYGNFISDCVRYGMIGHQNGTDTIGDHVWYGNIILMPDVLAILGEHSWGMLFRGRTDAINNFFVYNNTIINPVSSNTAFCMGAPNGESHGIRLTSRNNALWGLDGGGHVSIANATTWGIAGTTIDYNAYYTDDNTQFRVNSSQMDFTSWQALGIDANSVITDPALVGAAKIERPGAYVWSTDVGRWPAGIEPRDFIPSASSGLLGVGTNLSGYMRDFRWNPRASPPALGAQERYTTPVFIP